MLTENLDAFFADFGVPAQYGAQTATVLLDMPDGEVLSGRMLSVGYAITYRATDLVGLKHNDAITVNGAAYVVNEVKNLDDGALKHAGLQL